MLVVTPVTPVLGRAFVAQREPYPPACQLWDRDCSEQSTPGSSSAACEQARETEEFQKNVIYTAPPELAVNAHGTRSPFLWALTSSWSHSSPPLSGGTEGTDVLGVPLGFWAPPAARGTCTALELQGTARTILQDTSSQHCARDMKHLGQK